MNLSPEFMDEFFRWSGVALFAMMLLPLYRVIHGPTAIDRIVAVNVIGTKTAVLLVIIGTLFHRVEMFVDFAIAYSMLNFIGSICSSRYFFKTRPRGEELRDAEEKLKSEGSNA